MSDYSSLLLYSVDHMGFRREEGQQKRRRAAARLFEKMCTVEIWRKLSGRRRLLTFNDLFDDKPVSNGHYLGLHTVPLTQIKGSEGRSRDFDVNFRPLYAHQQEQWVNVATAWLAGQPLPPVQLLQVGNIYLVRDGHHRISVARSLGQQEIEAEVTVIIRK